MRQGGPFDRLRANGKEVRAVEAPSTSSGRRERGFAPWRAHRPFDKLRANGKEVRAMKSPSIGSGRTERGFAPWRAHRPFDKLRANGKEVRAVEGPSTLRQAEGERKEGSRRGGPIDPSTGSGRTDGRPAPRRAVRPFDRLRAGRHRVNGKEGPFGILGRFPIA